MRDMRMFHRGLLAGGCAALALVVAGAGAPLAARTPRAKAAAKAAPADPIDESYTAAIRKYTTEPYLSTELVNYLPASATVPSPDKVLGYVIGTPDKLTHVADIYRYYDALAKASPRVRVWRTGKSEEGRDFLLVAISDDATMARIDHYRQITAQLADPRKITPAQADALVNEGKPMYWLSGSIHSPETGSPEMLMELAYRLAVDDSPTIERVRRNIIVLIRPVLEVDGRDREVDLYNWEKANPGKPAPSLIYWGHYVMHDNNRDAIYQALALSRNQTQVFSDWHPQVLHDLHESEPFLYISTGTGPYNPWLDPMTVDDWQQLAYNEIQQMTSRGVPGVWTHGFFDGWGVNYMAFSVAAHNAIGRFYETFGNGGADTKMRTVPPAATTRTWYRPNPPLGRVLWSMRDNVNMQQSGALFALDYMAEHAQWFLREFYEKSVRSVAKATTEGPAAYAIYNRERPALAARLVQLLERQLVEVQKLASDATVTVREPAAPRRGATPDADPGEAAAPAETKVTIPAGSYIVRMDQPSSRAADELLDTEYYSVHDPPPYDDTGWMLGPMFNVRTLRITDASILKAPMTPVAAPDEPQGRVSGSGGFYLINATAEPALAALRFQLKDVKMFAAEAPFQAGGHSYRAGTFIIPSEGNPSDLAGRLEAAAKALDLRAEASAADPAVARHALETPRIAILHTWVSTQQEGWFRLALEEAHIPYTVLSDGTVRTTPNLRDRFDVILFPPATPSIARLIEGIPKRMLPDGSDSGGPIPWKASALTPSFGLGPDQADDIRGGLGFTGLENLKEFVEQGGLLVPVAASAELPIDVGLIDTVTVARTPELHVRGSVIEANVEDKKSPIAYGYDDHLAVYFNTAPVFHVSLAGGGGFFGGGGEAAGQRLSGRGSLTDPDVVQARPYSAPAPTPHRSRAQQELYVNPDLRSFAGSTIPPPALYPRVVVRFADEKDLWVSGMLAGGQELANTPAVVDVPLGKGHIVLFAPNPMWRQTTQGDFMLVLNAVMNYDHLNVGWPPAWATAKGDQEAGEQ
ncbi:MAG TPA: M14 family zinc carboxypeptidase [Candidatus Acidoferrales bacterium]|nr:M14 family zinc carboxypeptidase [Candidatus Acidoferrales bacterium]